jgi:hypothetical protein
MCGSVVGTGGWAWVAGADESGLEMGGGLVDCSGLADGVGACAEAVGLVGLVGAAACDVCVVHPPRQRPAASAVAATRRPVDFTASVCRVEAIWPPLPLLPVTFPPALLCSRMAAEQGCSDM